MQNWDSILLQGQYVDSGFSKITPDKSSWKTVREAAAEKKEHGSWNAGKTRNVGV